jgi:DNA-binding XRE family transcriptional regulator
MDKQKVGQRLRELRGRRTLEEVANALGIARQSLWAYETGLRSPRDPLKVKIARYYRKTVQQIFFTD